MRKWRLISSFVSFSSTEKKKMDRHLNMFIFVGTLLVFFFFSFFFALSPTPFYPPARRLVGLVVKVLASEAEDPVFESRMRRDFSGSSHTSGLKIGIPVATLPGGWYF